MTVFVYTKEAIEIKGTARSVCKNMPSSGLSHEVTLHNRKSRGRSPRDYVMLLSTV